jgi:cytochrome c oxidase assembly protein subunit 15
MALVLTVVMAWFAAAVWRAAGRQGGTGLKELAALMVTLLVLQITLGAAVIWTGRNAYYTTAHVLVGALTLAATFLLTWVLHRDVLEGIIGRTHSPQPDDAAVSRIPIHA